MASDISSNLATLVGSGDFVIAMPLRIITSSIRSQVSGRLVRSVLGSHFAISVT